MDLQNDIDFVSLLKKYEDTNLFEILLNIILVYGNARSATLVELNNLTPEERKNEKDMIYKLISTLKLNTLQDPFISYRFFVTKNSLSTPETQEDIAKILEFVCIGHDFGNQEIVRLGSSIYEKKTNRPMITEVCESEKISRDKLKEILKSKIKKMNDTMKKMNLEYRFHYSIAKSYPKEYLIKKSKNIEFVKKHLVDYVNLIYNDFFSESRFVKNPDLILEKFDLFGVVISIVSTYYLEKSFANISDRYNLENIERIESEIKKLEDILFEIDEMF
jgi:prefoldin subunit 5